MTPDPHLLPDGSTSWGPDESEDHLKRVGELGREAFARVAELEARWEKDNLCGICPYRESIQARVAELEAERDQAVWNGVEALKGRDTRITELEAEVEKLRGKLFAATRVRAEAEAERDRLAEKQKLAAFHLQHGFAAEEQEDAHGAFLHFERARAALGGGEI